MENEELEVARRLEFHGVAYIATVSVAQQQLHVQVEAAADDASSALGTSSAGASPSSWSCWAGSFPSAYVEELTRKTGNFKRFSVFVDMLLSAVERRSDAVFVDLLTNGDLELYRKRKMGKIGLQQVKSSTDAAFDSFPNTASTTAPTASKRYLILTYAVEFDRVHYPLPLNLVQTPTVDHLQRTIRRLRQELAASRGNLRIHEDLEALREENRCLKNTLKQQLGKAQSENRDFSNLHSREAESPIDLQHELKVTLKENKELIDIYQQYRKEASAEIADLKAEIRHLQQANGRLVNSSNMNNSTATNGNDHAVQNLQRQLEQERSDARRRLNDSSNVVEETLSQLEHMKAQWEETQLKNRELLRQLAIARAKAGMNQTAAPASRPLYTRAAGRATAGRAGLHHAPSAPAGEGLSRPVQSNRQRSSVPIHFKHSPHHYGESDDEEDGHTTDGDRGSTRRLPQRSFRRFDPTAYQQEKQRKLRMNRSQSPHSSGRPAQRNSNHPGYTSDSSAGGYLSAASNNSNRSNRRGRSRTRHSVEHQRAVADRLSSPKRMPDPDTQRLPSPQSRAPLPRSGGPRVTNTQARSPSPAFARRGSAVGSRPLMPPPPPPRNDQRQRGTSPPPHAPTQRPLVTARKRTLAQQQGGPPGKPERLSSASVALLADTTADSFSDIDDRLNALQQFLKEAKRGGRSGGATHSTSSTAKQAPE